MSGGYRLLREGVALKIARRVSLAAMVWGCVVVGFFGLACVPAGAAVTHEFLPVVSAKLGEGVPATGPHGEAVPLPGALREVHGLAVGAGEVYVADGEGTGSYRQDRFAGSSGAFVSQFPQVAGLSYLYAGIAVDHSTGEVYVAGDESTAEGAKGVVAAFSAADVLQGVWKEAPRELGGPSERFDCFDCQRAAGGVAVDNSAGLSWAAGDVYVADPDHGVVDVFKPLAGGGEEYVTRLTGTEAGVPFESPVGVAVSQVSGEVLVVEGGGTRVDLFRPAAIAGQYEFVGVLAAPGGSFTQVTGVAVDGGNGDIYVAEDEGVVDEFDAGGAYVGQLTGTPAGPFGRVLGVAVDPESHHVYVGTEGGDVDVFGEDLTVPDVVTGGASGFAPGSATLNGTVDPDGIQLSDCRFEYGPGSAYGQSVPCVPGFASIPADSSVHAVSAVVSGLVSGVVYHYRLVAGNEHGRSVGGDRELGAPAVDGESAASATQSGVTLRAQVDPDGVDGSCQFQYVEAARYERSAADPYGAGGSVPCVPGDLGAGTSDVAASAELSGLRAGVAYHWRVVAVNAVGTTYGEDEEFMTVPAARIDGVTISNVTGSGATLSARIDPLGTDTSYHFEYGTSTAYGASVPVPDADIGAGTEDVVVQQQVTGLQANTTYHVRVVASSALGVERSGDQTFIYDTSGEGLPDGREYEMVTPVQKNGAVLGNMVFGVRPSIAEDGSRLILTSLQCFAEAASCTGERQTEGEPFAFTRTGGGWVTSAMAPSAAQFEENSEITVDANSGLALFSMATPPFGEDDWYAREPDGSFVDIGPENQPATGAKGTEGANTAVLGTADLSHLVYEVDNSFFWPFDATTGGSNVYEYSGVGNAQPVLVGVSGGPGSTDLISRCATELGGDKTHAYNALSADGDTAFFTALNCAGGSGVNAGVAVPSNELFARIDGSRSVLVSGRSPLGCTSPACLGSAPGDARFEGASVDGSRVFFTDTQQLTDGASEDSHSLYEYDFSSPAGHNLVDVSGGDTSGGGPRVQGVTAISEDGSHVYFVAKGVLTGVANERGQFARNGAENLYAFERDAAYPEGHLAFITSMPTFADEEEEYEWTNTGSVFGGANVTPDGRFLVFTSHGDLTADDTSTTGAAQVFRYDAQTGALVRISVGQRGFNDNGNAGTRDATIVWVREDYANAFGPVRSDPTMSDDGSFVFFESPVGLTPGALNDVRIGTNNEEAPAQPIYAENVYEWHEGQVYLISDGRDTSIAFIPSFGKGEGGGFSAVGLLGSDASGANVFFTTADPLVAQDTDRGLDYYDARICTASEPCAAAPPQPVSPCQGEGCHGTPSGAPVFGAPASAVFSGTGNVVEAKPAVKAKTKAKPKKAKLKRKARRRAHGRKRAGRGRQAGRNRGAAARNARRVEREGE
jgi:hypothetical protein